MINDRAFDGFLYNIYVKVIRWRYRFLKRNNKYNHCHNDRGFY